MVLDTVSCGDCAVLMSTLEDEYIDLTVTSPPYDDLRAYKGYHFDFEAIARQLFRVTKVGGVVVWVVGDSTQNGSESGTSFRQALFFNDIGFNIHDTMIYKKSGIAYPSFDRYYQAFEYMFVFSKGKPKTFHALQDRKNRFLEPWSDQSSRMKDGTMKKRKKMVKKSSLYGIRINIWEYQNGSIAGARNKVSQHPAVFPEQLANDHILSWSNAGDVVFDPMCGSGTTLKKAKELGRRFIGFDISEEYCRLAEKAVRSANVPIPGLT